MEKITEVLKLMCSQAEDECQNNSHYPNPSRIYWPKAIFLFCLLRNFEISQSHYEVYEKNVLFSPSIIRRTGVASSRNQDQPLNIEVTPNRAEVLQKNQIPSSRISDIERPVIPDRRTMQGPPQYPEFPDYNSQMPQLGRNSYHSNQISYQMSPPYPDKASHIFNHKENGLQVPEPEISQYSSAYYPKARNNYGGNYRQPYDTPYWIDDHQDDPRHPARPKQEQSYKSNDRNSENQQANPEHIRIKMAQELKTSKNVYEENVHRDDSSMKIFGSPAASKGTDYPDVVAYHMDGNDGVAETPGGAVLSLTFGLLVTCIMAIMIGCRLRIVKRRMRKGGNGFSHDSDYLVNGMYL